MTTATALCAALALAPTVASACPSCAARGVSPGIGLLVGAMILTPYLVAGVVVRAIRRGERAGGSAP